MFKNMLSSKFLIDSEIGDHNTGIKAKFTSQNKIPVETKVVLLGFNIKVEKYYPFQSKIDKISVNPTYVLNPTGEF